MTQTKASEERGHQARPPVLGGSFTFPGSTVHTLAVPEEHACLFGAQAALPPLCESYS